MKALAVLALAVLASCAATPHLSTPTGKPEVVIPTADREAIVDAIVSEVARFGWVVAESNRFSTVFQAEANSMTKSFYGQDARVQVIVTMSREGDGTHLYGNPVIVASEGARSGDRKWPMGDAENAEVQRVFEKVREQLGGDPASNTAIVMPKRVTPNPNAP